MRHKQAEPSFEDLLAEVRALPAGHRGNILDGIVTVVAPANPARAHTIGEISATLYAGSPLGDPVPEGFVFRDGVDLVFGEEGVLVADIAGWRLPQDRLPAAGLPVHIAPMWVCEVLGDSPRSFVLTAKRNAYAQLGVQFLWIADPEAHVLEVFRNQRGKWLLIEAFSEESAIAPAPFEEVHFDASDLWNRVAPQRAPARRRRR